MENGGPAYDSFKRQKHHTKPHEHTLSDNTEHHKTIQNKTRDTTNDALISVAEFYRDKVIFITGATGFLGKVFLEKLLRSCTGIRAIFCLIRSKKGQSSTARLNELIEAKIFDKLRKTQPLFHTKLHVIEGDITMPNLGISTTDAATLADSVNVVFHSAATIRFDEPLKMAIEMNVLAVRKMIKLSRTFTQLQALVHISTVYCNCDRSIIDEKIYPVDVDYNKLLNSLEWMDDAMVTSITPNLIGNKPNTYTYTKHMAEHLLSTEGQGLPIAILRPSIVGAAWKEPVPGWIDNYSGSTGIYIATGKGILKSMRGETRAVADIVPVDFPVNIGIIVAWYTAVVQPSSLLVYHSTTGSKNPFTWGEMEGIVNGIYKKYPLENAFRRPNVSITNNSLMHDYWTFVSHMIPAYVADMAFTLIGKKPRMVKAYTKLHRSIDAFDYFTSKDWDFTHNNVDLMYEHLTPEETKVFYFDPRPLHWRTYIENYCLGAKTFVLNEDMAGVPAARAHLKMLRNIRYTFNTVFVIILWRVLIARSHFAKNIWYFIMSLAFRFVRYFRLTSVNR